MKFLVNTEYFSEAANHFMKHGVYTKAPEGSPEFFRYWNEQKRRCLEGYTVGDISITGRHYFYLNFCPIKRSSDETIAGKKSGSGIMSPKELLFPRFWLLDYEWFWIKHISVNGITKEKLKSLELQALPIKDYTEGKHLVCVKTRRAGFSYKEAADGVYNYMFIPKSISYYFAAKAGYLTSDGILDKVVVYLDHLDQNTGNFWRRNRMQHNSLTDMRWKSSYIDYKGDIGGYQSEIIGLTIKDPNAVRGKDGMKIVYEESGSFKNLSAALDISVPSVTDGGIMTGQITVFGTGGEEGESIEGLASLATTPWIKNFMEFNNIWEEGLEETLVGYHVPCYMIFQEFMDKDGNIDVESAIDYDESIREIKRRSPDPKDIDRRIAEFPRTIDEALSRAKINIFPIEGIKKHIRELNNNKDVLSSIRYGVLSENTNTGKVDFIIDPTVSPINHYPHSNNDNLAGAVAIFDPPVEGPDGKVDGNQYQVVVDPYYKEVAESKESLWAAYVFKKLNNRNKNSRFLCASYVGRPASISTCHENTVLLSKLYGFAKIQSEIAGGGEDLFRYLRKKRLVHLANFQPLITSNKEVVSERNRSYFMNVTGESKKVGLSGLADWINQPIGLSEEGTPVRRYQTIDDIGMLQEMAAFNDTGNFDRISALLIYYFMMEDEAAQASEEREDTGVVDNLILSAFDEEWEDTTTLREFGMSLDRTESYDLPSLGDSI